MIEVIVRGVKHTPHYEVTCRKCGSQLRFQRSDAEYISDQRDGDALRIACPVCNEPIYTSVNAGIAPT